MFEIAQDIEMQRRCLDAFRSAFAQISGQGACLPPIRPRMGVH